MHGRSTSYWIGALPLGTGLARWKSIARTCTHACRSGVTLGMNTAKFWSLQAVVIVIIDSKPAWCKRERRIRVADAFASQASLQALDSSAKLPVQSRSRGFKQAPACNMDESGAPCRTVRGPGPCLDLTLSLFLMPVLGLTLQGILARWSPLALLRTVAVYCSITLHSVTASQLTKK